MMKMKKNTELAQVSFIITKLMIQKKKIELKIELRIAYF